MRGGDGFLFPPEIPEGMTRQYLAVTMIEHAKCIMTFHHTPSFLQQVGLISLPKVHVYFISLGYPGTTLVWALSG